MSRISLKVWCPKCNSENVAINYDGEKDKLTCHCFNCIHKAYLDKFTYLIEDFHYEYEEEL